MTPRIVAPEPDAEDTAEASLRPQSLADFVSTARHKVQRAHRQTRVAQALEYLYPGQRRLFGRLEHRRVAGGQGAGQHAGRECDWKIEW